MSDEETIGGVDTISEQETQVKKPRLYRVILLNDDYTTMDFVVAVLEQVFQKSPSEATQIMLQIHNKGSGVCGIFPRQIAEAKVDLVHRRSESSGCPLRCRMEEE